jgi:hypothetical protein
MTTKAGIWIDHHKAVIVVLKDNEEIINEIFTDGMPPATKHPAAVEPPGYTRNDYEPEDRRERKEMIHLQHFYDEVIGLLPKAETLLVFGPGEAKGEFVKRLGAQRKQQCDVDVITTDKLTSNQITAFVREHFQKS